MDFKGLVLLLLLISALAQGCSNFVDMDNDGLYEYPGECAACSSFYVGKNCNASETYGLCIGSICCTTGVDTDGSGVLDACTACTSFNGRMCSAGQTVGTCRNDACCTENGTNPCCPSGVDVGYNCCTDVALVQDCSGMDCGKYNFELNVGSAVRWSTDVGAWSGDCHPGGCDMGQFKFNQSAGSLPGRENVIAAWPSPGKTIANYTTKISRSVSDIHGTVGLDCLSGDGVEFGIEIDGVPIWSAVVSMWSWQEFSAPLKGFNDGNTHTISFVTDRMTADCDKAYWDDIMLTSTGCCLNSDQCPANGICYGSLEFGADANGDGLPDYCQYGTWVGSPPITSGSCGDRICSAPGENRTTCPKDCCFTNTDGECSFYDLCGQYDPDCCAQNSCIYNRFKCENHNKGDDCYPGKCSAGAGGAVCDNTCSSFSDCKSGFCGTVCSATCMENNQPAVDFGSCCECWNLTTGICEECHSLEVRSVGFTVYQGKDTSINYQLSNPNTFVSNINITLSGPLKDYITLTARDTEWTGSGFSYIGPLGTKNFQASISNVPDYLTGIYQIKLSISYDQGASSDVSYALVIPVKVAEQGRSLAQRISIGTSRIITRMNTIDNYTLPVEVMLSAW